MRSHTVRRGPVSGESGVPVPRLQNGHESSGETLRERGQGRGLHLGFRLRVIAQDGALRVTMDHVLREKTKCGVSR
jgi:hypothetical protein